MKPDNGNCSKINMGELNQSWVKKHPKLTGLIITALLLVILLLIIDKLIPIFQADKKPIPPRLTNRAIVLRENHPGLDIIIDPENYIKKTDGLEYKDFPFRIDNNGFLLPHNIHVDPEHIIVFMGGSSVESMYVDENLRFPRLTELELEDNLGETVNVYNAGASGNHALHSVNLLLNKIVPLKPDIVVISHAINDYVSLSYDHTYWVENSNRSIIFDINDYLPPTPNYTFFWHLRGLVRTIYPNIYQSIYNITHKIANPTTPQADIDEWQDKRQEVVSRNIDNMKQQFTSTLNTLLDICINYNITPVLMTQANRFKVEPDSVLLDWMDKTLKAGITYHEFKTEYDSFNYITREIAKMKDIVLIDLDKSIPKENKYIYDSVHYNDNGSILVSGIISKTLEELMTQQKYLTK